MMPGADQPIELTPELALDIASDAVKKYRVYGDQDDATQEAAIRLLEVAKKYPNKSRAYYFVAAKGRLFELNRGDRLTGAPSRRGKRLDASSVAHEFTVDEQESSHLARTETGYNKAEWAASGVLDAVHTLPPRQRDIALAVAKGPTVSEYAKSSGLSVPGAFNAWRNAKEKLTNTLATYEEEAA